MQLHLLKVYVYRVSFGTEIVLLIRQTLINGAENCTHTIEYRNHLIVILSVTNGGNRQVHINQFEEFHQYTQTAGAVNHTGTEDGDIHTLLPIFKADFFTCFLALTVWAERILRMFNVNRQVLRFP